MLSLFEMTNSNPKEGAYISELIERDVSSMPPNFHLSISKLISDHFEMATAQVGSQNMLLKLQFENYLKPYQDRLWN